MNGFWFNFFLAFFIPWAVLMWLYSTIFAVVRLCTGNKEFLWWLPAPILIVTLLTAIGWALCKKWGHKKP